MVADLMSASTTTQAGTAEPDKEQLHQPWLFRVLCASAPGAQPSRHLLRGLDAVEIGRGERAGWSRFGGRLSLSLADPRVSSRHARLERIGHLWQLDDRGSRNGTMLNGGPISRAILTDGDLIEIGHTFFVYRELPWDGEEPDAAADPLAEPIGLSTLRPDLARELARLRQVASSTQTILVLGESGTGKELVARAVHTLSARPGPLVAVNCGALPESMVEAELFGHRRGAFSGAMTDRAGLMRAADRGTLFLDEIGDLRLSSQAALLRALQEREVTPVGAEQPIRVDLRVVAATHRPLERLEAAGDFRGDLFARLRGFVLRLPPLRERREDLGLMVAALLRKLAGATDDDVRLSGRTARALLFHSWPRNVRELENALGTGLALSSGDSIRPEHVADAVLHAPALPNATPPVSSGRAQMDRERLTGLLREHHGNVTAVARAVGKARTQVVRWLERFAVDPDDFRA